MKVSVVRLLNSNVVNGVLTKFRSEAPVYLNHNKEVLYKKLTDINSWYTRVIGLDEVKLHQDRVIHLQERLLDAQEKRREVGRHLAEIRKKSNSLQDEIHKVKRSEDLERFLNLMKEETEVMRLENEVTRSFQEHDQTERELFSAFTNAVRDSHEKQRAQLEYTKYFGIVLSIAGSFLAFCFSTIRKNDLKHFIEEQVTGRKNLPYNDGYVIETIRAETKKLTDFIASNSERRPVATKVIQQEEENKKQLLYIIGGGVVVLTLLKLFSS